ncbi:hypothetical protein [Pseudomonas sp. 37 R 15]|nr:hypothetical protein [Pseudomonas sp. 37 R 15]
MSARQKKHPFDFKTQYGFGFNPQDDEIVVGGFCGRAGTGLEIGYGCVASVAKNHNPATIRMHTANHHTSYHFTTVVLEVDPDETACLNHSRLIANTYSCRSLPVR